MTDDLIAYLMDDLSPERRAEVDAKLETDVVWRWELQRLRECMAADGDVNACGGVASTASASSSAASSAIDESSVDIEPPRDLVQKTCCFVEDSASGKFKVEKKRCSKKKAAFTAEAAGACKSSWSLADVTVASGVGLILAALILPAVHNSRTAARLTQCASNLKSFGTANDKSSTRNGGFLRTANRGEPALVYVTNMVDEGTLTPEEAFAMSTCPESLAAQRRSEGLTLNRLPTTAELMAASGSGLLKLIALANVSYALPNGYFDESGAVQPLPFEPGDERPLVTDAPIIGPAALRPNSHGGCTQNVLNSSGCVTNYSLCVLSQEDQRMRDIHLNDAGLPAAGNTPEDIFLAPADYGPDGRIGLSGPFTFEVRLYLRPAVPR